MSLRGSTSSNLLCPVVWDTGHRARFPGSAFPHEKHWEASSTLHLAGRRTSLFRVLTLLSTQPSLESQERSPSLLPSSGEVMLLSCEEALLLWATPRSLTVRLLLVPNADSETQFVPESPGPAGLCGSWVLYISRAEAIGWIPLPRARGTMNLNCHGSMPGT